MATYSSFIARYPQFAELEQSVVTAVLSESTADCTAELWGLKRDRAIMLLTAHVLTLSNYEDLRLAGGLAVVGEGQLPDFFDSGRSDEFWSLTVYGQQLQAMLATQAESFGLGFLVT